MYTLGMVRGRVSLDWGWVVWLVVSLSLVPHINNISRVSISGAVGHNLGATVREGNTVLSRGSIAIPLLIGGKVGTRVVISNSIAVLVDGWLIIRWLLVCWGWVVWSWLVHNWGWVVDWGRLVHNWGWVVRSGVGHLDWVGNHWSWVVGSWLVDNWGWVVHWGRLVVDWSWLVVNWCSVVSWSWVVVSRCMDWLVGWSMHSSAVLLSGIGVVDILGSSMGLAGHNSGI